MSGPCEPVLKHGPITACGGNARKRASKPIVAMHGDSCGTTSASPRARGTQGLWPKTVVFPTVPIMYSPVDQNVLQSLNCQ